MAARYYSPLYVKYGFEKVWGLSQAHGSFLNDGYINMLFGELGYFGTVLFVVCIGIITSMIYKIKTDKKVKALSMAIILGLNKLHWLCHYQIRHRYVRFNQTLQLLQDIQIKMYPL